MTMHMQAIRSKWLSILHGQSQDMQFSDRRGLSKHDIARKSRNSGGRGATQGRSAEVVGGIKLFGHQTLVVAIR